MMHPATTALPGIPAGVVLHGTPYREPYARETTLHLTDLTQSTALDLATLISALSSENTASTSELLGAVRMLAAIARAVRNRSYVLMAAATSDSGAALRCMAASRVSKASVKSFTLMGLTVLEVDLSGHGSAMDWFSACAAPDYTVANIDVWLLAVVQPGEFVTMDGLMQCAGLAPGSTLSECAMRDALLRTGFTPTLEMVGLRRRGYRAPAKLGAKGGAA